MRARVRLFCLCWLAATGASVASDVPVDDRGVALYSLHFPPNSVPDELQLSDFGSRWGAEEDCGKALAGHGTIPPLIAAKALWFGHSFGTVPFR